MGLLEDILARAQYMPPPGGGFPAPAPAISPEDEAARAEAEMIAAGHRRAGVTRRALMPAPDAQAAAVQLAMENAPPGTGVPLSAQAGMISPFPRWNDPSPLDDAEWPAGPETVPMPQPRPAEADLPPGTPSDSSAARRSAPPPTNLVPPALPPAPPASQQAGMIEPSGAPSFFDNLRTTLGNNSNTLLALGAGLAGAPNIGQGISRAAAAAIPARAADIQQRLQMGSQAGLQRALIDAGVPRQQAFAAVGNPKLADALITSYITDRGKTIQMIKTKDPWGGETEVPYVVNKFPRDGEPIMSPAFKDESGAASPVPGVANPGGTAIYAPGINQSNFDHSKVGEEYIQQLSPEMQSDVKAYLTGRSLPVGRGSPQVVKQIAKKYGDDIGMSADDASIGQRKEWSNSLANTKSGVGLSSKGFKQGLEHFVGLSDNLVKMKLSNGLGLEPLAGWVNSAKNLTTEQQELVHKNEVFGQALAREMGNLFSKSGGGVHEAAETKKHISSSTMSSKSAAGSLEGIDELMQGGLRTLEGRRDELFPQGSAPRGSEFNGPKQQEQLAHIRRNIAILRGEAPPAEAASSRTAPADAVPKVPVGRSVVIQTPNGPVTIKKVSE